MKEAAVRRANLSSSEAVLRILWCSRRIVVLAPEDEVLKMCQKVQKGECQGFEFKLT